MVKVGDIVRFLSSTGGGRVVRIEGNIAHVEEEDGFETPMIIKELVVVGNVADQGIRRDAFGGTEQNRRAAEEAEKAKVIATKLAGPAEASAEATAKQPATPSAPEPEVETAEGDVMNVMLGFEAVEVKHLNTTTFEAYLVNDSNYYLYFTFLSRADDDEGWNTRYAGLVEPNMTIFLEEFTRDQVARLDRLSFQYVAFKRSKQFALKNPVAMEMAMDTTKFFKLHCFRTNPYFERPVIAIDIVRHDRVVRPMAIDSARLQDAMIEKKEERRERPRISKSSKPERNAPLVVDLHINELLDTTAGLSPAEILNYQIDYFRKVMDENLRNRGLKIVFIHGKGEGVLRQALLKELNHRYRGHAVQDASFREYGYGATQVTI